VRLARSPVSFHSSAGICYSQNVYWEADVAERKTISFTDLPVSQGARDLMDQMDRIPLSVIEGAAQALNILAAADERDVRTLLWARRVGKL
jgi:hypothetical protein